MHSATNARSLLNSFALRCELLLSFSASTSPIVLLGKEYKSEDWEKGYTLGGSPAHWQPFLYDFHSRFWITYRSNIPTSNKFPFSSDAGWGCMIRTGQMMVAQAYVCMLLGRDWLLVGGEFPYPYWRILHMFRDIDDSTAPFSIQNILKFAARMGMKPGEWLSPTKIGDVLCQLISRTKGLEMAMHVCRSATLVTDFVYQRAQETTGKWMPIIIYVPLRLGVDSVNPIYIPQLLKILSWKQSLGIAGGKPRTSCYFVGFQDESLLYLDPHVIQSAVGDDSQVFESYHCRRPLQMSIKSIDPCMGISFLCLKREDFVDLCQKISQLSEKKSTIIINVLEKLPQNGSIPYPTMEEMYPYVDESHGENDEFVLL